MRREFRSLILTLYRVDGQGEEEGGVVVEAVLMSSHMSHSRIRFQSNSLLPALLHDSCGASHSHGRTARTDRLPCLA